MDWRKRAELRTLAKYRLPPGSRDWQSVLKDRISEDYRMKQFALNIAEAGL